MQEQKAATLELSCTRMLLLLVNHTLVQNRISRVLIKPILLYS